MGVGAWCAEPELVDSVSLSLSFSHSLHDLPISVFSQVVLFFSFFFFFSLLLFFFFPEFSRHLLDRAQMLTITLSLSHTLCMTCGGEGAWSKTI